MDIVTGQHSAAGDLAAGAAGGREGEHGHLERGLDVVLRAAGAEEHFDGVYARVLEQHAESLCAVERATAADAYHQVGLEGLGLGAEAGYVLYGRVLLNAVKHNVLDTQLVEGLGNFFEGQVLITALKFAGDDTGSIAVHADVFVEDVLLLLQAVTAEVDAGFDIKAEGVNHDELPFYVNSF